jgi:hypothetical protein
MSEMAEKVTGRSKRKTKKIGKSTRIIIKIPELLDILSQK